MATCFRCDTLIRGMPLMAFPPNRGSRVWRPVPGVSLCVLCGGNGNNVLTADEYTRATAGADDALPFSLGPDQGEGDPMEQAEQVIAAFDADPLTGEELKAAGQAAAADAVPTWFDQATASVARLARLGTEFTSEDVIAEVGLPNVEVGKDRNNAVGSLMTACAKRGMIHRVGRRKAKRRNSHSAEVGIWLGGPDPDQAPPARPLLNDALATAWAEGYVAGIVWSDNPAEPEPRNPYEEAP